MIRMIIILTLLLPGAAMSAGDGAKYFITIHNGAYNFKGGAEQMEESRKALLGMIKLADARHVRLTLLFSAQYAEYIASDPSRMAELEGWKKAGHEIGAYHTGPDTRAWDGYSDLPEETLARTHKDYKLAAKTPGHREYFSELGRLAFKIKAGCVTGLSDKGFLAAAPEYETCSGADNRGGGTGKMAAAGFDGVNNFLTVYGNNKKSLSCSHPANRAGSEASKKAFLSMASGVYGASFNSSPGEFGAFYAWLEFLKGVDPQGLRDFTVSAVVEGGLLPEKKGTAPAEVPASKKIPAPVQAEARKQEFPRIRPVKSLNSQGDGFIFGQPGHDNSGERRGYCGDGICDIFEKSNTGGPCLRDCGK
ncbi:MAG: hypothetical protein WCK75_06215 [Elusimicrobiota bacterium]